MKTITLLIALLIAMPLTLAQTDVQRITTTDIGDITQYTKPLVLQLQPGSSSYAEVTQGQQIILATSTLKQTYQVTSITETEVNLMIGGDGQYSVQAKQTVLLYDLFYVTLLGTQRNPYSGTLSATLIFSLKEKKTSSIPPQNDQYDLYGTIASGQKETFTVEGTTYQIYGVVRGDDYYFEVNGMTTGSLDVNKPYKFRDGTVIVALGVNLVGDAVVCEDGDDCSNGDTLISFALNSAKDKEPTGEPLPTYDIQETLASGNTGRYTLRGNVYEISANIGRGMVSFTYLNENTGAVKINNKYTFQDGSVIVPLKISSTESPPCLNNCPKPAQVVTFGFNAGKGKPAEPTLQYPPVRVGETFVVKVGESVPVNPPQAASNVVMNLDSIDVASKKVTLNWGTGVISFSDRTQLGSGVFLVVDRLDDTAGSFHWETQVYNNFVYVEKSKGRVGPQNLAVLQVVADAQSGDVKISMINNGERAYVGGNLPYFIVHDSEEKKGTLQMEEWRPGEVRTIRLEKAFDPDKYNYPTITGIYFVINPEGELQPFEDDRLDYEKRIDDNGYAYIFYNKHYNSVVNEPGEIQEGHIIELDANKPSRVVTEIAQNPVIIVRFKDGNKQINVPIKVIDYEVATGFAAIGNPRVYTKLFEGQSETGALGLAFEKAAVKLTLVDVTGTKGEEAVIALEVVSKDKELPVETSTPTDIEFLKKELLKLKEDLKDTQADLEKTQAELEETKSWVKRIWEALTKWI